MSTEYTTPTINISYSSELITNYLQAETVAPDAKFQALQTPDGHSLLFSIGTDNVLYLTEEILGEKTGWQKNDISSALASNFPESSNISVKTFAASQNPSSEGFCLLLALRVDDEADHLFMASSYAKDESNNISIDWTEIPYDGLTNTESPLNISDIYLMDTPSEPLIVVDLVGADNDIARYYIDTKKNYKPYCWVYYNLPYDMAAGTSENPVTICAGRKAGESYVNGLYTQGIVGGTPSIIYQQLYNVTNVDEPGAVSNLRLPNDATPNNIASSISVGTAPIEGNYPVTFTDLYATADNGGLYFFAADNQSHQSTGVLIMNNALFADTEQLFAFTTAEKVVVWGRNREQQVFYTECYIENGQFIGEWSYPLPIATAVQQISPYVNRKNGGNTYFAHTGKDELKKTFQDPNSTIWKVQDIFLPSTVNDMVKTFDSYTTKINLKDESNAPLANAPMFIASAYRVPVYINNHYYVLDTNPTPIESDTSGSVTIVQKVDEDMQGACLSVQASYEDAPIGNVLAINPMDNTTEKVLELNTSESLAAAEVKDDKGNVMTDENGNTITLVPSTASDSDLEATVDSLAILSDANSSLETTDSQSAAKMSLKARRMPTASFKTAEPNYKVGEKIVVAAGDLFNMLKTAKDYVIEIVERTIDAGKKVWDFVCTIGGEIFTFVIDTVEKVVGAIQSVLQAIGTLIKDLVQFVKFLFSWDDIKQTQMVFSNITRIMIDDALATLKQGTFRNNLNQMIDSLQVSLNNWADIPNDIPCPSIDEINAENAGNTESSEDTSATDDYLSYHFTNNVSDATMEETETDISTIEELLEELTKAIEEESEIITDALNTFYTEVLEDGKFRSMSLFDILKKTIVILADLVIDTAQNILNTLLDMLITLAEGIWDYLNSPVWIPILSNILEEFFDYELPSWLDIVMLIGAMPATMSYKLLKFEAPFPKDSPTTSELINANTIDELTNIITGNSASEKQAKTAKKAATPTLLQEIIFIVGRSITVGNNIISAALIVPTNTAVVEKVDFIQVANMANNLACFTVDTIVGWFASPAPVQDETISADMKLLNAMFVAEKAIFTGCMIRMAMKKGDRTGVKIGDTIANFIMSGISAFFTLEHVYELITEDQFKDNPVQASLALTHCGVEFCIVGNTGLGGLIQFTPNVSPTVKLVEESLNMIVYGVSASLRTIEALTATAGTIALAEAD